MSGAYYNDSDAYCAAWLRNLIRAGLIAPGDVDERPIQEVSADELAGFTQWHLFAGIAGWSAALRLAEWPDARPVLTASVPCQPFSAAGKRHGHADDRNLWPHALRLIRELRPPTIFGEQVAAAVGYGWLDGVCDDLEREGYAVAAIDLPTCSVGAPHIRQRLFWVAHAESYRRPTEGERATTGHIDGSCSLQSAASTNLGYGGLADRLSAGLEGRQEQPARDQCAPTERGGDAGGLGDASRPRSGRDGRAVLDEKREGAEQWRNTQRLADEPLASGFWADSIWLPCLDGKARRVPDPQSGVYPLAHGVSARVGRLRAYGNSIVVPLAAEFIRAVMDVSGFSVSRD